MFRTSLTCIAILWTLWAHAQHQKIIDSLHNELNKTSSDSLKARIHFEINDQWARFSLDSGIYHADKILEIANKTEIYHLTGLGYSAKGKVNYLHRLDSAGFYFEQAREVFREVNDSLGMADTMIKLSYVTMSKGQLNEALDHNQQAMAIYQGLEDEANIAEAWYSVASIYRRTKQLDMAKHALSEAILIYRATNNLLKIRNASINLSGICAQLEQYDSAIMLSKEAYLIANKLGYTSFPISLVALGETFQKMDQQDSAYKYYQQANARVDEYTPAAYKTYLYFGLFSYYMSKGQLAEAQPYMQRVRELGSIDNNMDLAISYYQLTAGYFQQTGDFEKAYKEQVKYTELKEKYHDQQLLDRTTELEQVFEKEKRELEIAKLQAENERKEQQTRALIVIAILSMVALVFLVIVFRQRQSRNRLQQQLLHEEINGLRLRLSKIFSEVKLEALDTKPEEIQTAFHNKLTEREAEILQLAVTNKTNAEIAEEVHLSVNTVKYHMKNIYSKIGVSSRLEARQIMSSN